LPFTNLLESVFHKGVSAMPRILIVDSYENFGITLQGLLEREGYECLVVQDGAEALIELENGSFDLVISDFDMPVVSGIQLLQRMAERSLLPTIPVIMVIGIRPMLEKLVTEIGAYALLVKPYTVKKLFALVSQALESRIKENFPENNKKA